MQYQHLVFEEFARKVSRTSTSSSCRTATTRHQPGDRRRVRARGLPLRPLDADRDRRPASIRRFDQRPDRPDRGLPQPARVRLRCQRRAHTVADSVAAGDIVRGMTRQVGNEIDEFVTERAAQQPARPAARPRHHQPRARSRHRRAVAERGARASSSRPTSHAEELQALRELGRLRRPPQARGLDHQLHRRLRHARLITGADDHRGQARRRHDADLRRQRSAAIAADRLAGR